MIICVDCRKEMVCVKTGKVLHYGGGHCYSGDQFLCKKCLGEVVVAGGRPYQNNAMVFPADHIDMQVGIEEKK